MLFSAFRFAIVCSRYSDEETRIYLKNKSIQVEQLLFKQPLCSGIIAEVELIQLNNFLNELNGNLLSVFCLYYK